MKKFEVMPDEKVNEKDKEKEQKKESELTDIKWDYNCNLYLFFPLGWNFSLFLLWNCYLLDGNK